MASEFLGKILFLFATLVFISWPVLANVYAWKYSKPSGIAVSTLTAATFICFIIVIAKVLPDDDEKFIVVAISILCFLIAALGILSFPVLANVYAWKVDKTAGEVVSSLTGGAFLAMIIAQILNGRVVTQKVVENVSNVVKDVGNVAYGAAGGRRVKTNYRLSTK